MSGSPSFLSGLLEFLSMAIGLKAMTLVAAAAYAGAFLLRGNPALRKSEVEAH